ncbi:NADAR domain-containing protein [Micromonosporaceae bacterium B7E4]
MRSPNGPMADGHRARFTQHPPLRAFLVITGDRVLVEASPLNRVWGIGLFRDDLAAEDPHQWRRPG